MGQGRTVYQKTSYSNVPFNHVIYDIVYDDGTTEKFGPTSNYIPNPGDSEDLGQYGTRIGWFKTDGSYAKDFSSGMLGGQPIWVAPGFGGMGGGGGGGSVGHTTIIDMQKMLGAPKPKGTCTKCKEEVYDDTLRKYNWSSKFEHKDLERRICQKCHAKAMDKLYETEQSVETEEVLYGSKDKKRDDP